MICSLVQIMFTRPSTDILLDSAKTWLPWQFLILIDLKFKKILSTESTNSINL